MNKTDNIFHRTDEFWWQVFQFSTPSKIYMVEFGQKQFKIDEQSSSNFQYNFMQQYSVYGGRWMAKAHVNTSFVMKINTDSQLRLSPQEKYIDVVARITGKFGLETWVLSFKWEAFSSVGVLYGWFENQTLTCLLNYSSLSHRIH